MPEHSVSRPCLLPMRGQSPPCGIRDGLIGAHALRTQSGKIPDMAPQGSDPLPSSRLLPSTAFRAGAQTSEFQ